MTDDEMMENIIGRERKLKMSSLKSIQLIHGLKYPSRTIFQIIKQLISRIKVSINNANPNKAV